MPFKAEHCGSHVFHQQGKKTLTRGKPIPPVSFRKRQPSCGNAQQAVKQAVRESNEHRGPGPTTIDNGPKEVPSRLYNSEIGESLSQDMSSQLTLTGEQERHPEQCTPEVAPMAMQHVSPSIDISKASAFVRNGDNNTINGQRNPAIQRLALDISTPTSTQLSEEEAEKNQATVDRLNARRDEEDPDFELARTEHDDECDVEHRNESALFELETSTVDNPGRRSSSSEGIVVIPPRKRASPEPEAGHSANTPKKIKVKDSSLRPRTHGKRYSKLNDEGRAKRTTLLQDIEHIWGLPCHQAIPQELWLHGDINLSSGMSKNEGPLVPADWTTNLLQETQSLARLTPQRPGVAVAALRQAVAQQSESFGGPPYLWSVSDVTRAAQLVQQDDEPLGPATESSPLIVRDGNTTILSEPRRANVGASTPRRRDSGYSRVRQLNQPQAASTSSSTTHPEPGIKIETDTPVSVTPPLFMARTTSYDLSRLSDDEALTLFLRVEFETKRRADGGTSTAGGGSLSGLKLTDLTLRDLARFAARDFNPLRKMVVADWEQREAAGNAGSCLANAIMVG